MKLWDFQEENIEKIFDFYNHGGNALLLQQPTGTGKSKVCVEFVKRNRNENKPVYFVTSSKNLLHQFSTHLSEHGLRHGIVSAGFNLLPYNVQVISAHSLTNRITRLAEPWAVIFEEAHHSSANVFKNILNHWSNVKLLGVTATPNRPDGTPLSMYEHLITSKPVRWFIDNYYLADYDYFIPCEFDTSSSHHKKGDFNLTELAQKIEADNSRLSDMLKHYQKLCDNISGIAFGTTTKDADNIAKQFSNAGYDMRAIHSKASDSTGLLQQARDGNLKLISTCDMIGEGVDVKGLTALLDGRPTESLVIAIQHWGRVLRALYARGHDLSTKAGRRAAMLEGGKGNAQILDFSSNYIRHGLPCDDRDWNLDHKVKLKTASELKRCPDCSRPVKKVLSICPHCKHSFARTGSEPRRTSPDETDGHLININILDRKEKNVAIREIAVKARSLTDAETIAAKYKLNKASAFDIWVNKLKNVVDGIL